MENGDAGAGLLVGCLPLAETPRTTKNVNSARQAGLVVVAIVDGIEARDAVLPVWLGEREPRVPRATYKRAPHIYLMMMLAKDY
jgi:hypothetical protein